MAFREENAVSDREIMSSTAFGRAMGYKQLRKMERADDKVLHVWFRFCGNASWTRRRRRRRMPLARLTRRCRRDG